MSTYTVTVERVLRMPTARKAGKFETICHNDDLFAEIAWWVKNSNLYAAGEHYIQNGTHEETFRVTLRLR